MQRRQRNQVETGAYNIMLGEVRKRPSSPIEKSQIKAELSPENLYCLSQLSSL